MTIHETVVQAVRAWIRVVRGWTEQEAADLVIPADRGAVKGRRPAIPFLVVDLAVFGQQVGTDEAKYAADLTKRTRGTRRGRVNIQGFGLETSDWLEEIAMHVELAPSPLSVNAYGEIVDISELADTHIEARYSRDFDLAYAVLDERDFVAAEQIISEIKYDPDNETLVVGIDADLS